MRRRSRSNYVHGGVPLIYHSRSKFDLSYSHKTTGNVGELLPLYIQEVYPGDTFKCDSSVVARTSSPFLKPVMDNLFCDVMFFYVPSRTLYDSWPEIFGENNDNAWARTSFKVAPNISSDDIDTSFDSHDIASYLGMPVGSSVSQVVSNGGINLLPFRAYAKIYNEWYRDENLQDPMLIQKGDFNPVVESFNHNDFSPSNYTGKLAKVSKLHDYFTQLLPAPQKGSSVDILPIQSFPDVDVYTGALRVPEFPNTPLLFRSIGGSSPTGVTNLGLAWAGASDSPGSLGSYSSSPAGGGPEVFPVNLYAKTSDISSSPVSVNDLRLAFQTQKMLERDSIYGTRYTEHLLGTFGISSPDSVLQRSEFLGGRRFPLNVIQATQTSASESSSALGNVGAWSLTNGRAGYTKAFTEYGFVIGMFCIRQFHSYQQGVEKFWWRKNRLDYLNPLFTNIGYQPVFTKELYAEVSEGTDTVFGYAPAFEDLRCRQNRISGQLASASGSGFDIWHFGDNYDSAPVLGAEWIEEDPRWVDRALSVSMSNADQFLFDVYFKQYGIRVLPTYGEPGLIDHH